MVSREITTAEQLLHMPDDGCRYELVRGELSQMSPAGFWHGSVTAELAGLLREHVKQEGLGLVLTNDPGFVLSREPDTVRAPDVAFVRAENIPDRGVTGFTEVMPDLVAEVVSPNDRYAAVQAKVAEWMVAGVRMVLVVDPTSRSLTVHRESGVIVLREADVLLADDVVPGWRLVVRELFAVA